MPNATVPFLLRWFQLRSRISSVVLTAKREKLRCYLMNSGLSTDADSQAGAQSKFAGDSAIAVPTVFSVCCLHRTENRLLITSRKGR